jgi:uncharacterized membrane protein
MTTVEQQRERAAAAGAADQDVPPTSGAAVGVSEHLSPAAPVPADAPIEPAELPHPTPADDQATLLGALAPHVEPFAIRSGDAAGAGGASNGSIAGIGALGGIGGLGRAPLAYHPEHLNAPPPGPPAVLPPGQPAVSPPPHAVSPVPPAAAHPVTSQAPAPADAPLPDDATVQDFPPSPAPLWEGSAERLPLPGNDPRSAGASPRVPRNVPWQAAESWGSSTITISATTAAGASYLFWWVSGLLIYFNERHNRFVRFHAMQSMLLTGALTVFGVVASIVSALCGDIAQYARDPLTRHLFGTLGWGILVMAVLVILFVWVPTMIAAWTGNYLRIPIVGQYAERYSAPPIEPTQPPLF